MALFVAPRAALPESMAGPAAWSSVAAAASGALLGAGALRGRGASRWVPILALLLIGPGILIEPGLASALPSPLLGAGGAAGLGVLGAALGAWSERLDPGRGIPAAAFLLTLGLAGHGAATGLGLLGETPPFGPELTARLLDLSPRGFVLECGGADWMRSPSLYDPAGTDRIGPDLRGPWAGAVAAPVSVVVGCVALLAALRRR